MTTRVTKDEIMVKFFFKY